MAHNPEAPHITRQHPTTREGNMSAIYETSPGAAASSGWWFSTREDAEDACIACWGLNGEDVPGDYDPANDITEYEAPESVVQALVSGECDGSPGALATLLHQLGLVERWSGHCGRAHSHRIVAAED